MSKNFKLLIIFLVACHQAAPIAFACQTGWKSPEELEKESGAVVSAKIVAARHVSTSFRGQNYEYDVTVIESERGNIPAGKTLLTYEDLQAHLRGQVRVCPLKNGSGIEHDLKPNKKYKLYLKSASEREILLARFEKD